MRTEVLLGDEAVALGAIHAGICAAFSYPGTPATEILEFIERFKPHNGLPKPAACWSTNEKVAYEEALGVSYAGKRSLVSMKHVGLNVAADPFINSAVTGAHGALVIAVADDPGMHSSQNEQDSRYYAHFARLPMYEPADQQQAYEMTLEAFEKSEKLGLPVMIRLVTRLAHSRAVVEVRDEPVAAKGLGKAPDASAWTLLPVNARRQYAGLLEKYKKFKADSDESRYNRMELAGRRGIITSGIAYNYVRESLPADNQEWSLLHIQEYPLPVNKIRQMVQHCDDVLVIEDGYPFIEEWLNGVVGLPDTRIRGKQTGDVPASGELNPDIVRKAMGLDARPHRAPLDDLAQRPPQLCQGCPHADAYHHIVEALKPYDAAVMFSDIGCYTLGALPPYNAIESCVDMGASIGMARGAAIAGLHPACCAIGDSTFVHSGMTPLVDCITEDTNMTVFILDNSTVAMTGGQPTLATGDRLLSLVKGLGADPEHIKMIEPLSKYHEGNVTTIRREIDHPGLSVIIAKRPCIQIKP